MPSDQSRIIEQAKFTYSPLSKAFKKQIKTIEDQGIKQVEALKVLNPQEHQDLKSIEELFAKKVRNIEIKNEMNEIKKWQEKIKQEDLIYKENKYKYDSQQYETIRSFSESIYAGKINIDETEMDQSNLLENTVGFNEKSKPRRKRRSGKNTFGSVNTLCGGRELTLNAFKSRIFLIESTQGRGLKK